MNPLYRYSFANAPAVRQLAPGEMLTVEFPDSDGLGADLQPLPAGLFEGGTASGGNPVFGPIAVEGAEPGDALRVHFSGMEPNRKTARTWLGADHGFLPDAMLGVEKPSHMYLWEVADGLARVTNPLGEKAVVVPVRPFLGCVATATSGEPLSTMLAGNHGGNIDHPDLVEGTSLCLPVSQPGAMLYVGDMHAAQGHGETAGGGLEISGKATIRVELAKGPRLTTPRYQTPQGIGSLGIGADLREASRIALSDMIHWLASAGWNVFDANMLVSQTCSFRMGAVTERYAVMSCFLAKEDYPTDFLPWP